MNMVTAVPHYLSHAHTLRMFCIGGGTFMMCTLLGTPLT